jgi:hypothetical protein
VIEIRRVGCDAYGIYKQKEKRRAPAIAAAVEPVMKEDTATAPDEDDLAEANSTLATSCRVFSSVGNADF